MPSNIILLILTAIRNVVNVAEVCIADLSAERPENPQVAGRRRVHTQLLLSLSSRAHEAATALRMAKEDLWEHASHANYPEEFCALGVWDKYGERVHIAAVSCEAAFGKYYMRALAPLNEAYHAARLLMESAAAREMYVKDEYDGLGKRGLNEYELYDLEDQAPVILEAMPPWVFEELAGIERRPRRRRAGAALAAIAEEPGPAY